MTPQQAFDLSWNHFVVQRKPLGQIRTGGDFNVPNFRCRYRTPEGNCCAVGLLFPPDTQEFLGKIDIDCPVCELEVVVSERIDEDMLPTHHLRVIEDTLRGLSGHGYESFLDDLQTAHDGARPQDDPQVEKEPRTEISNRLRGLATAYKLEVPACTSAT